MLVSEDSDVYHKLYQICWS